MKEGIGNFQQQFQDSIFHSISLDIKPIEKFVGTYPRFFFLSF